MSLTAWLSENLDSLTPPDDPIGWTEENNWQSGTAQYYTSPNGLKCHTVSSRQTIHYSASQDGNGGDVLGRAKFRFVTGCGAASEAYLFLRASSPETYAGIDCYMARALAGSVALFYRSGGANIQLGSTITTTIAFDVWYELHLQTYGTTLTVKVQRLSDGLWLTSGGTWIATEEACLTVEDTTLSGQGYVGVVARNSNSGAGSDNKVWFDDLDFSLVTPDVAAEDGSSWPVVQGVLRRQRRARPVWQRRARPVWQRRARVRRGKGRS
jgi:hypothetical protein